ncbi:MAG: hypothetical protein Q8P10_00205 [bacterium]|nr:hypothetical protein [bacterium]
MGITLIGLFIIEFLALFLFSRSLSNSLANLFYSITKNRKITIYILSLIFLPGTIIHELSHLLTAGLLFVPIDELELLPKFKEENEVQLGSVQVGKTDILRRTIIGLAPTLIGLAIIFSLLWFFKDGFLGNFSFWQTALILYAIFEIGNTMFSSKKDLEGLFVFFLSILIIIFIIFITLFITHHIPSFSFLNTLNSKSIVEFFKKLDLFLLVPIGMDLLIFFLTKFLLNKKHKLS